MSNPYQPNTTGFAVWERVKSFASSSRELDDRQLREIVDEVLVVFGDIEGQFRSDALGEANEMVREARADAQYETNRAISALIRVKKSVNEQIEVMKADHG